MPRSWLNPSGVVHGACHLAGRQGTRPVHKNESCELPHSPRQSNLLTTAPSPFGPTERTDREGGDTMPDIDVWVTVADGVADTVAADCHRAQRIFSAVPLNLRVSKFLLTRDQTRAILGSDGKLAVSGSSQTFTHNLPIGEANSREVAITVEDRSGNFTSEVWAAIRNWTDLGGLHVFYVPDFSRSGLEGGLTLRVGDMIDPIIFVAQTANQSLLSLTRGRRGVLEHEIGHAFGLADNMRANTLMLGIVSSDGSDAGTTLLPNEMQTIRSSRLLRVAAELATRH